MTPELAAYTPAMRIHYDRSADAAYIYLREIAPGDATTQLPLFGKPLHDHVVLDFDRDARLIGIDVMSASRALPEELLRDAPGPTA